MVVGVAEAVPCVGLAVMIAEFVVEFEGLLAVGQRLLVLSEQGAVPADRVESTCLPGGMAGRLVQAEGLAGLLKGLPVAVLQSQRPPQAVMAVRLAHVVTEGRVQLQRAPQVLLGLLVGSGTAAGTA